MYAMDGLVSLESEVLDLGSNKFGQMNPTKAQAQRPLQNSFGFASLPDHIQQKIAQNVKQRILLNKAQRFKPSSGVSLYLVEFGIVKTFAINEDGKERIIDFYLPGEALGFDVIHSEKYNYLISAVQPTELCEIPVTQLLSIVNNQPEIQHQLLKIISQRMQAGAYVTYTSTESRLIGFLLEFAKRVGSYDFRLPLTREEIGNYLGLASETITRVMTRLQSRHLIVIDNKQVNILKPEQLQQLITSKN